MVMAIKLKSPQEIQALREGGHRLATIVAKTIERVAEGVTTRSLDEYAQSLTREYGDTPAFLGYKPYGHKTAFPGMLCISVNEEVVHGLPGDRVLVNGDVVTIDGGLIHDNLITDHAITVIVGDDESVEGKGAARQTAHRELLAVTRRALEIGIAQVRPGGHIGDIGAAIQEFVDGRYGIIRELAGHGVGYSVHEDPYVPNYGKKGTGIEMKPGLVIAIEPMLTIGKPGIITRMDGYTIATRDKSLSAHFEHTVVVTEEGCEVLTVK
jgi:methionyl aminopeptidase